MNFGRIGLGILAGASNAAEKVAGQWREDDIRAENQRMELEKEARIEKAAIRREDREYLRTKETEQRNIANKAIMAQQEIDIANKPENVQAKANAEKALAQAKVDVELDPNNVSKKLALKEAENKLEIAKQVAIHNATTDTTGRKLQNELTQLKINQLTAEGKLTEAGHKKVKYLSQSIKDKMSTARSILAQDSSNLTAKDMLQQAMEDDKELKDFLAKSDKKNETTSTKPEDSFAEYSKTALNQKAKGAPKETAPTAVNAPVPENKKASETSEKTGILPKPKAKQTGETSPLLTGDLKEKYDSLSQEYKNKVNEILSIENADSNRKLQLIQDVIRRAK